MTQRAHSPLWWSTNLGNFARHWPAESLCCVTHRRSRDAVLARKPAAATSVFISAQCVRRFACHRPPRAKGDCPTH